MKKVFSFFFALGLLTLPIGCFDSGSDKKPTGSLSIVNNSASAIDNVLYSLHTDSDYGVNRISTPIAVGTTFTITGIPVGTYDILCSNATLQWQSIDMTAYADGITIAEGQTRTFSFSGATGTLTSIANSPVQNSSDAAVRETDESDFEYYTDEIIQTPIDTTAPLSKKR